MNASEVHSHHHDLNQKAAFMHVVADAVTSILPLSADFANIWAGIFSMLPWDCRSILVAKWAPSLMQETGNLVRC